MTNVLENIIKDKKESLLKIKQEKSLDFIEKRIKNLNFFYDFKNAIKKK